MIVFWCHLSLIHFSSAEKNLENPHVIICDAFHFFVRNTGYVKNIDITWDIQGVLQYVYDFII